MFPLIKTDFRVSTVLYIRKEAYKNFSFISGQKPEPNTTFKYTSAI